MSVQKVYCECLYKCKIKGGRAVEIKTFINHEKKDEELLQQHKLIEILLDNRKNDIHSLSTQTLNSEKSKPVKKTIDELSKKINNIKDKRTKEYKEYVMQIEKLQNDIDNSNSNSNSNLNSSHYSNSNLNSNSNSNSSSLFNSSPPSPLFSIDIPNIIDKSDITSFNTDNNNNNNNDNNNSNNMSIEVDNSNLYNIESNTHIIDLLNIRSRHKAPKELINDILAYIHHRYSDKFIDPNYLSNVPTSYQEIDRLIQDLKSQFIKVI